MLLPELNAVHHEDEFTPLQHYKFSQAIEAKCVNTNWMGGWVEKKFIQGECLNYSPAFLNKPAFYVFKGTPIGEKVEHYFHVPEGKGANAKQITTSKIHLV